MIRRIFLILLLLFLLTGCTKTAQPQEGVRFLDHTGTVVTAPRYPKKVALLTSSLADLWITAGGKVDITVGQSVDRGFAEPTAILVDSGAGKTVNLELLLAQKPDLVLYASDLSEQRSCGKLLMDAGIPAAGFSVESFGDYLAVLKICTDILGTPERYETYGTEKKRQIDAMIVDVQGREDPPSILFVRAGSSAKVTKAKTAENHFVCAMLKELGTYNIAEKAPILLDGLSTEEILLSDPDHLFFTTMGEETAAQSYVQSLLSDPVWKTMTAVKEGNVCMLPKELFQYKPNARWPEAYAYLIEILYGEDL